MTKPGDSQTKKTIHELAKEFPNKTYRELEKYRDADRNEEAQRIFTQQENEELTESQQKQEELEPIEGVDWEKLYNKEHKLRQEAETETILVKGIGMNSPEMKSLKAEVAALKQQLHTDRDEHQKNLDKIKQENNDLYNRIAKLAEKDLQKARESGL
jgi:hypothetical protein